MRRERYDFHRERIKQKAERLGYEPLWLLLACFRDGHLPFIADSENREMAHLCAALQGCGIEVRALRTEEDQWRPEEEIWVRQAEILPILEWLDEAAQAPGLRDMTLVQLIRIARSHEP